MDWVRRAHRLRIARLVLFAGLLVPALLPATSSAAGFRVCRGDGAISMDQSWGTLPPFRVAMSSSTAAGIARRAARKDHVGARAVPCLVAHSVVDIGIDGWENWAGDSGWLKVTLEVASQKPYLGRFYCVGEDTAAGTAETCTHTPDRHAGRMVVKFTIFEESPGPNPCNQPGAC